MREIVCIGDTDEVKKFLEEHVTRVTQLFDELGLPVELEPATDPFFGDTKNPKYVMQKLDPVKLEMVLPSALAIGSLNNHRDFFAERYDIRRDGNIAQSACVAFGLERWVHAFIKHFGHQPADWPTLATLS